MSEIKCPSCDKVFKVDAPCYAKIGSSPRLSCREISVTEKMLEHSVDLCETDGVRGMETSGS